MKKASPDSQTYLDRIRSWARSKAHGPSPLSKNSSRPSTLPLSSIPPQQQQQLQQQQNGSASPAHNDTTNVFPFPSNNLPGFVPESSNSTANNVADNTSSVQPEPAPPPQADGQGAVIEDEKPQKTNVLKRFWFTGKAIVLSSYVNLLLVFVPVGIASKAANLQPGIIFGMNAIAIIPLAGLLSHATESVAKRMGDTIGALMNVTFGNAVELIIFMYVSLERSRQERARSPLKGIIISIESHIIRPISFVSITHARPRDLQDLCSHSNSNLTVLHFPRFVLFFRLPNPFLTCQNEIRIVQASLLGSILANLLLILGMCFLLGGLRFQEQIYNSTVTQMSACLLSLSVMSLLLPTAFHASFKTEVAAKATRMVLKVSRGTSVILLLVYGMYLLFQLKSHAYMYQSTPQHIIDEESAPGPVAQWMESSDDSSSSSSDSDSDGSSGSNTTAKRVKRLIKHGGRRRRKSSAGSRDTPDADTRDADTRPPSLGTSSISPVNTGAPTDEPQTTGNASHRHNLAEDADDEHPIRSRRNSHGSSLILSRKERKREKEGKRQEKRDRKKALRNKCTITEGVVQTNEKTNAENDPNAPRRVDFAVISELEMQEDDSPQKRARTLRGLNLRPQMPKTFSQNVFTQPAPTPSFAPPAGPIPRVRMGIRRTNSLPDRLNQTTSGPPRTGNVGDQPHVNSLPESENPVKLNEDDDENISRTTAICLLLISTGLVAVCAEFMVDSINAVVEEQSGLSETFIGLIILPIVGNAAEHVTAVTVATKNKMDLAIGVAVGSSIQIALFVTPFIVLLGWAMGKEMSLYFTLFETVSLFVSAFIVNFLVLDGRSNYLEGALLCAAYVIIAVAAFFYPNESEQSNLGGNADASSKMIRSLVGGVIGI
ncbi:Vacuolar calcium ion transporter [Lachnellula subtilissima]|uniref:Vacuolar calcium ion transporter n=1 Tax=Lachnellula subtilissima TaxID=602034 RepID=A0A8H8U6H1_9HELO|nr:Vacuolar calcium ion transporter [Lachnellula subtilissima]